MHPHLQTRSVEFPVEGGGKVSAFEARPSGAGSYPGVLISGDKGRAKEEGCLLAENS